MVVRKIVVSGLKFATVDLDLLKTFVKFMFLSFLKAIIQILSQYKRWNDSRIVLQLLLHTYTYIHTCLDESMCKINDDDGGDDDDDDHIRSEGFTLSLQPSKLQMQITS